jgi:hypothetical protein
MDAQGKIGMIHIGVVLCVVGSLIWAIPSPTYDQRIVYKDRTVEVPKPYPVYKGTREVPSTYQSVYDKCVASTSFRVDNALIELCHRQAREASTIAPTIKYVERFNSYKDLFNNCNDGHTISEEDRRSGMSAAEIRNQRIQYCHMAALQGSKAH